MFTSTILPYAYFSSIATRTLNGYNLELKTHEKTVSKYALSGRWLQYDTGPSLEPTERYSLDTNLKQPDDPRFLNPDNRGMSLRGTSPP